MALGQRIQDDTKAALLERRRFDADVLRGLKAAILNEEVAQGKRDEGLSDGEIEKIITREVKKRRESIAIYEQNGRPELAEQEKQEVDVLSAYLPEQLDEEAIRKVVQEVIAEIDSSTPQAMGQVIGAVKAKTGSAADGAIVARIVKELLQS